MLNNYRYTLEIGTAIDFTLAAGITYLGGGGLERAIALGGISFLYNPSSVNENEK